MYNLLEYNSNYTDTRDSSWFYSKDEAANFNVDIASNDDFILFKFKPKLLGDTEIDGANGIFFNSCCVIKISK